ncbi:MAG TPA: radical SAM protein [Methanobacterium sp.]
MNESKFAHLTKVHPCFNEKMHDKVGRIHVPIAPKCNIQCNFCTREINKCEMRPGVASCIMSVEDAIKHVDEVTKKMPISVVGVAGPGDALFNPETFEFFREMDKKFPELIKCISTNGLLLPDKADELAEININSITVTVNAIYPEIGKNIYSMAIHNGKIYDKEEAFNVISKNQLEGIKMIAERDIVVKVNSVLIPGLNDEHIVDIAKKVKGQGASLMNVIPLIPLYKFKDTPKPDCMALSQVRDAVEEVIPVFRACTQCRADAYGVPGKEDKHLDLTPASHY